MSPDRWQRIKECFDAAAALAPTDRDEYLRRASAGDDEFRREVEKLLASDARAGEFLREPTRADVPVEANAGGLSPGTRIGSYRLVRRIAAGGMGAVWLGERADDQFRGRVAVKFIHQGMDSEESVRRFRLERQFLANLQHPNIGRMLDGGVTPEGRPYLVMEYVEGSPIDAYCDANSLDIPHRLELFRDVCKAVQYAHQHLIVHRDLKPSNILVNESGIPVLLDFGIAKLLAPDGLGAAPDVTNTQGRLLTPGYASPEQIKGEPITTASDVYSLGVLLYRLLTGRGPYRPTDDSQRALEMAVCEQEPAAPSAVEADVSLSSNEKPSPGRASGLNRRSLAGDLDTIVLMALRKEPSRRYASAEQLSEDIRRHLEGLPVLARPSTLLYRATKFAGRNRVGVMLATAIFVLLATLTIVTRVQSSRVERQRLLAEERSRQVQQVAEFQAQMLGAIDAESMGRWLVWEQRRQVGEGLRYRPIPGENGVLRPRTTEEIGAELARLDEALAPGNPTDTARRVMDVNLFKPAVDAIAAKFASQPEVEAKLRYTIGSIYHRLGMPEAAEVQFRRTLELQLAALGEVHLETAATRLSLGQLLREKSDFENCEPMLRRALEVRMKLLGAEHAEVATVLNDLGLLYFSRGESTRAEAYYRQALEMRRKTLGNTHPDVAMTLSNLSGVAMAQHNLDTAVSLSREAVDIYRGVGRAAPLATGLNNLGGLLGQKGDFAAAAPLLLESMEIRSRTLGDEHPTTIGSMNNLAAIYMQLDKVEDALPLARRALAGRLRTLGPRHQLTAASQILLADLLARGREYAEAETLLLAAWETLRGDTGATQDLKDKARRKVAQLYEAMGKPEKAAEYREKH